MKHFYLSACVALLSSSSFAQPIIDSANVQTSLIFDLYTLTNPGSADPSPTGANINYDFSSATIAKVGTAEIVENQLSPYATTYPDGNIAYHFQVPLANVNEWAIFKNSSTKIDQLANGLGGPSPVHYTETRSLIEYPFQYNTSFTDTYTKQGQAQESATRTYDAYGSLETSVQNFPNIIRISDSNGYIQFWNVSPLHPVVEIDGSDVTVWIPSTSNHISNQTLPAISCYPNPARDVISLQMPQTETSTIAIYSLDGKLHLSQTSVQAQTPISIANLIPNLYFITVSSPTQSHTFPFIKQ